jgi:hypothetical protein
MMRSARYQSVSAVPGGLPAVCHNNSAILLTRSESKPGKSVKHVLRMSRRGAGKSSNAKVLRQLI